MRPNTYANAANVPARMAVRPVARPSRPSLRFTAFEVPVTTNVTNSRYTGGGNTSRMYLNTGSWVEAGGRSGTSGHRSKATASATPDVTWPTSFQRATQPPDLPRTTFRYSSPNPRAPAHTLPPT